jgi:hypothetical protein
MRFLNWWVIAPLALVACGQVDGTSSRSRDREGSGGAGDVTDSGADGRATDSGTGGRATGSRTGGTGAGASSGGRIDRDASPGSGGRDPAGGDADGASGSGGEPSSGGADAGPPIVEETGTQAMRQGPTVWLGEVERVVTYPETLIPYTGERQRVLLILDKVASAVTGTVTFGSRPPPPPPKSLSDPYPARVSDSNLEHSPYDGFAYSIVSSELRGNTLILAFVPREVFAPRCALNPGPGDYYCDCDDAGCWSKSGPEQRLELVVSGERLEGQLSRWDGASLGETPAVKLDRVP